MSNLDEEYCALYLVSADDEGPCKIGIAGDPERRLRLLQTGHYERFKFHSIFWIRNRHLARYAERMILKRFSRFRMEGEWLDYPTWHLGGDLPQLVPFFISNENIVSSVCYGPIDPPYEAASTSESLPRELASP